MLGYGGCNTNKSSTKIEIRYLIVVDPALPFVEDKQLENWMQKVEEIFNETDNISVHFVQVGKVHLDSFLRDERWGQNKWSGLQKIDEQIDSLIESRLREYDLNYVKNYFESIKREGKKSQSFFLEDVRNAKELDFNFFVQEIRKYLISNVDSYRRRIKIQEDKSSEHLKFSFVADWRNALRNLKGADMILTNEIGTDIYSLGQVFNEDSFKIGVTSGLADLEGSKFMVSLFPWYYTRSNDISRAYAPAKDYYIPSVICHEMGHAIFNLQHDYSRGNFIMSASESEQGNWFYMKPQFSDDSKREIQAWVFDNKAKELKQGQHYKEAITQLQDSLQVKKDYLPAYQLVSEIYDLLGQKELAESAKEKSKEIEDRSHRLENFSLVAFKSYAKAQELSLLGRSGEAIEEYKKVITNEDLNLALSYGLFKDLIIGTYRELGILYTDQLKNDEAIEVLNKLLQIQPNNPKGLYLLGRNYYFKKDKVHAIPALKRFLALEKESLDAETARSLLSELSN